MMRPKGRPTIMAIAVPVTIILIASALKGPLTRRTAMGEATDQKIEWAKATPIRESSSVQKPVAKAEATCDTANRLMVASKSLRSG